MSAIPVTLVGAPFNSDGTPPETENPAQALREAGLVDLLRSDGHAVADAGDVAVPASDGRRDPATGVLNLNALQSFSRRLAHVLDAPLADDRFPLVIGGDCAILLGICGALAARQPSAGLVFFDTHGDFQLPAIACTACRSG